MEDSERDLRLRAEQWMKDDPDPGTRREILALLAASDVGQTDLADRFASPLEFGTAGLRGVMGAGPNRMNRAVVLRTTWGLGEVLPAPCAPSGVRRVVVGFDGRRCSREFAFDAALALGAKGILVHLFPRPVPTPLVAFAVLHFGAVAGIMVTASHNPAEYNGYKVYGANGALIIPPFDASVSARIRDAPAAVNVPRLELGDARSRGRLLDVPEEVHDLYLEAIRGLAVHDDGERSFPIVYTALHGVGDVLLRRALENAGFSRVFSVPEQRDPDPNFPTVAFPNPEESGAMDLAIAAAEKNRATLVLANDPDADRLAVALPRGESSGYVQLTGNQVGVLLGHYLLTERSAKEDEQRVVMTTIASSPLLSVIARALGVRCEETLTGFKWIANRAFDLACEGHTFVFGYEEALGYAIGDVVRDKDGISAAVMVAEMVAVLAARGLTLSTSLEEIYRRYGLFVSAQVSVTKKGAAGAVEIGKWMDTLRSSPPWRVGDHEVVAIYDYRAQVRVDRDGRSAPLPLPRSDVISLELAGRSRIVARPSGTEPKLKLYFDVCEDVREGERLADAETRANGVMKRLADAFVALT